MGHKSKSGPVRIIKRFSPEPLTPEQELARLRHKLALLEDRIAAKESYVRRAPYVRGLHRSPRQLELLLQQREDTKKAIDALI